MNNPAPLKQATPRPSPPGAATVAAGTSVGKLLQAGRKQHGKTRSEAAEQINLHPKQLDALENDQFSALPGDAFVRGYLRNYARWLELNEAELMATYIAQTGAPADVQLGIDLNSRTPLSVMPDNHRALSAALVVGVLILCFWVYNANRDRATRPAVSDDEIAVDTFSGEPLDPSIGAGQDNWENPFTTTAETADTAPVPRNGGTSLGAND